MTKTDNQTANKETSNCGCCCCNPKAKLIALAVVVGLLFVGFAFGKCCRSNTKIAVVDVVALVSKSSEVQALKAEQDAKAKELSAWLQSAQTVVNNEEDQAKKEALLKQYSAEFAAKREDIRQQYNQKLQILDHNITQIIVTEAQKRGFQLVMAKAYTLYGATDITEELAKLIK